MAFEHEWVQFFREQYQLGSRIRLRDLHSKEQSMRQRKMGTLEGIEDDGRFKVRWDSGEVGYLMPCKDSFSVLPPETVTMKLYMPLSAEVELKGCKLEDELTKIIETLYTKIVPTGVREYIGMSFGEEPMTPKPRRNRLRDSEEQEEAQDG